MAAEGKPSRRDLAQQSKAKLIRAGLDLLAERLASPFDSLRATDVAERAGFTPGAFYHHWASQDDYRAELRQAIAGERDLQNTIDRIDGLADDLADNPGALIRLAAREELVALVADPDWRVQLAMLASPNDDDRDRSVEQYREWFAALVPVYAASFDLIGRELRPGYTLEWFTRTVSAMIEGFAMQELCGLEPAELEEGWTSFELALVTLISMATVPIDGGSDDPLALP